MKSLLSNRYIWKVCSKRLADSNWDLTLTRSEALKNNELVSLASSSTLRMIELLNGEDFAEKEKVIRDLKMEIGQLKKLSNNPKNREKLIKKQTELNNLVFMEDYMAMVMSSKKHYDRAVKGYTMPDGQFGIKFQVVKA